MAKTKISEFSTTPGNNTDINGINISEGCAPSGINNAIRELMSDLKEWQSGAMDVYVIPQGTAAAPGIQLYGDLDTGLYGYAANQLGVAVGGASAGYFSSAGWNGNVNGTITGDINATTIDTTNLEVTNIKAKDGTAAITIADSTGVVSVSTTLDLTTVEVTNIKAKDGTTSISLADSTGIATFSKATVIETTDNTNAALRITQLGTGNALLVEDATNPDTTPTVIDQFGNVILGTTTRTTPVTSKIEIHGTASELSGLSPSLGFYHWSATASLSSTLTFRHYPSGTVGTLAANTSGDVLGRIVFLSYDGTNAFSASIRGVSGAGGTAPSITYDASGGHNFTSGPIDVENLEVKNIKARDGTAAASIADSTGVMTIASSVLTTTDINGGTIDGTTIGGSTAAAGTFTTATATTGNITTVNATTVDTTNLEVTNIKAKDGTTALSIADSTGAVTVATAFAANGGVTIGDASGDAFTINSSAVSTPNGLNFDSNTFVIDATNNRVGINNVSPTVALDVTGALTISGNAILGDASTDTVQVNGYMGVGGAGSSGRALQIVNTSLVGTAQEGIRSQITGTSAATGDIRSYISVPGTASASFTVSEVVGYFAANATLGAGSAITNQHGLYIADQTRGTNNYGITSAVSSGTNKWNIYASGTAANYFAGNVLIGTTTQPTGVGLNVASTLRISNANGGTLQLEDTDVADASAPFFVLQSESSAFKIFSANRSGTGTTGSVERFRLSTTEAVVNDPGNDYDFRVESDTNTHRLFVDGGADTVLMGTTTNTNSSKLVVDGTISETVSSVQYLVASQADIGTAPNEIPLNQYLGALAYEDTETPALDVGTGISTGTGTICKANGGQMGGIYRMTILIDLTGLNSGGTAGDIIGVNGTALPCYIARLPAMTVLGGRMTCLETPAGGDTDIDLYSATEGTGVEDQAITALTETEIINAGAQTRGTVTYFSADPAANAYFYLVGQGTANATYTAGRFLIEIFGVQ